MSDASSRPRPRPRPRPVSKSTKSATSVDSITHNNTPQNVASSSSQGPSSASEVYEVEVNDSDEMFMRNVGRSKATWNRMNAISEVTKTCKVAVVSDSDSDSSPKAAKKKRKRPSDEKSTWQVQERMKRLMSQEPLEVDDDDIEVISSKIPSNKGTQVSPKRKKRSRSRSITPPPPLALQQIINARNIIRQVLPVDNVRLPSPDFDPDDTIIIEDPELAKIAKSVVRSRNLASNELRAAAADDVILLNVKWQDHPLDSQMQQPMLWQFRMHRGDTFIDVFEAIYIDTNIPVDTLIMTCNGKRFFSSITPATLKLWVQADLVACERATFEYIKSNPQINSNRPNFAASQPSTHIPEGLPSPSTLKDTGSEAESDVEGDTFKIVLRSAKTTKDITLTVRPTTKCGSIVKAFLKKAGLADEYPTAGETPPEPKAKLKRGKQAVVPKDPRLCVDGDKLGNDSPISDADLEDGDMVEVVGL